MYLNPPLRELFGDDPAGAMFLKADLRMGVEVSPPSGHFSVKFGEPRYGHGSRVSTVGACIVSRRSRTANLLTHPRFAGDCHFLPGIHDIPGILGTGAITG